MSLKKVRKKIYFNIYFIFSLEIENDENKEEEKDNNNEKSKDEPLSKEEKKDNANVIEEKEKNKEENNNINNNIDNNINNNIIIDSYRKIDSNINRNSPSLIIEELECNLLNGQKIKINARGMVGGRGLNDGVTIFGCNTDIDNNQNNIILKSDFVFNFEDKYSYPYIFMIYFEKEDKSYYIRPYIGKNDDNNILYIKLNHDNNFALKQKELIFAGNILFQVSPIDNYNLEIVNLSKENISSMQKQTFDASSKKEVTIGRAKSCDFAFPGNKSFSRIQTTFEYDEENKAWLIIDGSKIKSQTNGTWILCTHSFQIKNLTIIEIMNHRLQITEENKSE